MAPRDHRRALNETEYVLVPCISGKWFLFQWVVFAESLQDQITADVSFKNLISTALLCTACILRHVHTITSNQDTTAELVSLYQLTHTSSWCTHTSPAPSEVTSTCSDHLHGGLSKHNSRPALLGWQGVTHESEFMSFLAMAWTCPECKEMDQLWGRIWLNGISDVFFSLLVLWILFCFLLILLGCSSPV